MLFRVFLLLVLTTSTYGQLHTPTIVIGLCNNFYKSDSARLFDSFQKLDFSPLDSVTTIDLRETLSYCDEDWFNFVTNFFHRATIEQLKMFFDKVIDINVRDEENWSIVELLPFTVEDPSKLLSILEYVKHEHPNMNLPKGKSIEHLLSFYSKFSVDSKRETLIIKAIAKGWNFKILDGNGLTPLHHFCESGQKYMFKIAIQHIDIDDDLYVELQTYARKQPYGNYCLQVLNSYAKKHTTA
jgi:hypothetical protein